MRPIKPFSGEPSNPHKRAEEIASLGLNDRKRMIADSAAALAKNPEGPLIVDGAPRIGDVVPLGDRSLTIVEIENSSFDPEGRGDWFAFGVDVFGCVAFNVTSPEEERAPAPAPQ